MEGLFLILALMPILTIASIWDWSTKKIPNALIFFGFISSVIYKLYFYGFKALFLSLLISLLIFATFILFWGVIGAGDIKLLMVISIFVGYFRTIEIFLFAMAILIILLTLKNPRIWKSASEKILYRIFYKIPMKPEKKINGIPLAPFLLLGAMVSIL